MTDALRRAVENTGRSLRQLAAYLSVWPRWVVFMVILFFVGLAFFSAFPSVAEWLWDWWKYNPR